MAASEESITDAEHAERRAREWLAARFELELVNQPPRGALYGLDPDKEWVFCVHDVGRISVGASRYVAVNRATGRVTEFEAGE